MKPPIEYRPKPVKIKPGKSIGNWPEKIVFPTADAKPQFDRAAYQREYMRRYRARKKAK